MTGGFKLTKPQLAVWLSVGALVPWQLGGKAPVAVLVSSLLMLLSIFLLLRSSDTYFESIATSWLPLSFLAWALVSLIWSVNRFQTVIWVEVLSLGIMTYLAARSFGRDEKLRQQWVGGYLAVATLASLWGITIYLAASYNRLTSSFYLANPFAAYILPAVLLSTWYFVKEGRRLRGACAPILVAALVLTDSRSALLMLAVGVATLAFVRLQLNQWLRLAAVVAAALVLVLGINYFRSHVFHHATTLQGSRFSEAAKGESTSASDRLFYLRSTIIIWQHYPLFGSGAGTFASAHPHYQLRVISAATNAHNFYAQTLSELGLVGALLLGALVLATGLLVRRRVDQKSGRALAIVVVLMIIHFGLDIDALYPSIVIVFAILVGLIAAHQPHKKEAKYPVSLLVGLALGLMLSFFSYEVYRSQHQADYALDSQNLGDYQIAVDTFAAAHSGPVYDPDVLTAEGINDYTLAAGEPDRNKVAAEYAQAKKLALDGQKLDPLDAQHSFLYARVLFKQHDIAGAGAAYKKTIQLDPFNHPEYYADLAYLYLTNNRPNDIIPVASAVLQQYPDAVVANRMAQPNLTRSLSVLYYFRALAEGSSSRVGQADAKHSLKLDANNAQAAKLLNGS